jgi:hypothetical protein
LNVGSLLISPGWCLSFTRNVIFSPVTAWIGEMPRECSCLLVPLYFRKRIGDAWKYSCRYLDQSRASRSISWCSSGYISLRLGGIFLQLGENYPYIDRILFSEFKGKIGRRREKIQEAEDFLSLSPGFGGYTGHIRGANSRFLPGVSFPSPESGRRPGFR